MPPQVSQIGISDDELNSILAQGEAITRSMGIGQTQQREIGAIENFGNATFRGTGTGTVTVGDVTADVTITFNRQPLS